MPGTAEGVTCLLLKLRGSDFPVKDSGYEGDKADPYYTLRCDYDPPGRDYMGSQKGNPLYKSKKVKQDLHPRWRVLVIDLNKLCNNDLDRKILLDIWDWDRFKSADFMSWIEVTPRQLIEMEGKPQGLPLQPPSLEHKQEVGELWVDRAELAYPRVQIAVLGGIQSVNLFKFKDVKKFANQTISQQTKTACHPSDLNITNDTDIPLIIWVHDRPDVQASAVLGKPLGRIEAWMPIEAGECEIVPRPDYHKSVFLLVLSPCDHHIVLGTYAQGQWLEGSAPSDPIKLYYDINEAFESFGPPRTGSGEAGDAEGAPQHAELDGDEALDPQKGSTTFKISMGLKLRGKNLPMMDSGLFSGKSDPFYEIRPAFGKPGGIPYVSPDKNSFGQDLPTKKYKGEHKDKPFLRSHVVDNDCNPSWDMQLVLLNELFDASGEGAVVDLSRKVLIDIYDEDTGGASDFMCYVETSLQNLVDCAKTGQPIFMNTHPDIAQDAGVLYVDKAHIGYPSVEVRACKDKGEGAGLNMRNCTTVPLKIAVSNEVEAFQGLKIGQVLNAFEITRCIMIAAIKQDASGKLVPRSGRIKEDWLEGQSVAMLIILNESNVVLGTKAVPKNGTRELHMNLERDEWALSSNSIQDQLMSYYQSAVGRIGDVSLPEVPLTDEDLQFFLKQAQMAAMMAVLLPNFGLSSNDCMDLNSYSSYMQRQTQMLQEQISRCDFIAGEGDQVQIMNNLLTKLHMIDMKCGEPRGEAPAYKESVGVLMNILTNAQTNALAELKEGCFEPVVQALAFLQKASDSELKRHVTDEEIFSSIYTSLLDGVREKLKTLHVEVMQHIPASDHIQCLTEVPFSVSDSQKLQDNWYRLNEACLTEGMEQHFEPGELGAMKSSAHEALDCYFKALMSRMDAVLGSSEVETKLGKCKNIILEASALMSLKWIEVDSDQLGSRVTNARQALDDTAKEIETRLRKVATFCSADWQQDSSSRYHLEGVPEMIKSVVEAEEWTHGRGASVEHRKVIESLKVVIKEVTNIFVEAVKAAVVGSTPDGLLKAVFISGRCKQGIMGVAKVPPVSAALELENFGIVEEQMEGTLGEGIQGLTDRVNEMFPFHAEALQGIDLATAVTVDFGQSEKMLSCIDAIAEYSTFFGGNVCDFASILAIVQDSLRAVNLCLKREVNDVLADGKVQAEEVDLMSVAMRTAVTLKRDHARIYAIGSCGDYVLTAVKSLVKCHDNLKSELMRMKDDAAKTEELLKIVSPLCRLDDCLENQSSNFTTLYREYEGIFKEKMEGHTKDVLGLIEEGQYTDVSMMMEQHGLKASVPWQIKAELSKKIEESMEMLLKQAKNIGADLPVQEIDEFYRSFKALRKASLVVDIVGNDVRKDFERFMDPDVGEIKRKLVSRVLSVKADIEQLLSSDNLGKAAIVIKNLSESSGSLQELVGDEMVAIENEVNSMFKDAVNASMEKMKTLPIEQWQYNPPSSFFKLFEGSGPEASILKAYGGGLDSVKEALAKKVEEKLSTSFLGAGSDDTAMLERAIQCFPEGRNRELVLGKFTELKNEAQGDQDRLIQATQDWDVDSTIEIVNAVKPAARHQMLETLQAIAMRAMHDWSSALGKDLYQVDFTGNFVRDWEFIIRLKEISAGDDEGGSFVKFCDRLDKILEDMKNVLATAEHQGATEMSIDKGDMDAFKFLKRLVKLFVEEGTRSLGKSLFPTSFCNRTRQVFRELVVDFKKETKRLVVLLHSQDPESAFDVSKIAKCLKTLRSLSDLYTETKYTLQMLDSAMGADEWTNKKDKLQSTDLASVMIAEIDAATAAWDPEMWADIEKKVAGWVLDNFKEGPELQARIKISSDRVLFFQLVGCRTQADSSPPLSTLAPFVSDQKAKALLENDGSFQVKVEESAKQLWENLKQKCDTLISKQVNPGKFDKDYHNKSDNEFLSSKELLSEINVLFDAAKLFKQHVAPSLEGSCLGGQMDLNSLSDSLLERVNTLGRQVTELDLADLDAISGLLITMHCQSEELLFQSAEVRNIVSNVVEGFVKRASDAAQAAADSGEEKKGDMGISKLGLRLRDARFRPTGEAVVRGYEAFQGYLTAMFNRKTEAQDIGYVISNIRVDQGNSLDCSLIEKNYKKFDARYKAEIKTCLEEGKGNSYLVPMIQKIVASLNIRHAPAAVMWTREMKEQIPDMVALVFAVWTLHHSKKFLESMDATDKTAYLFQPHPVQVVAIFCLLGVDSGSQGAERSLIQVRTGEGKSAVLGVSSAIFALFKCSVNVACYSEYLSTRDGDNIAFLFKALGVPDDVRYMTLTKVCEHEINKTVNIREALEQMITGSSSGSGNKGAKSEYKPRVLLVDEVDVFFTKSFYGSSYRPACDIRDPLISKFLRDVYEKNPSDLKDVKEWSSYKAVGDKLKSWSFIMDSAASDLIAARSELDRHQSEYVVKDDKIGYREQDSISFNVSFGYLTVLAYLKEHAAGKISEHSLNKNLRFLVACGEFLFAKSPQDFDIVMGVTGTLETMSSEERKIVKEDYHIKRMVYMPSVYGKNQVVEKLIAVEETEECFINTLIEEIEEAKAVRAVIVFFDSIPELRAFAKHPRFAPHEAAANLLLEEIYPAEKTQIVTCRSATMNAVTLASSTFGRGTDFQCMDDLVQQAGGIHIVQTHVAVTLSEEIQMKGRTARQGEKGSWSMVLHKDQILTTYGIEDGDMQPLVDAGRSAETNKAIWELINEKRVKLNMAELQQHIAFVAQNEKVHKAAVDFSKALLNQDVNHVRDYIQNCNKLPPQAEKARILVLLDATGSMTEAMNITKDAISDMFGRASELLTEQNINMDMFEMQIAVYRNYSSGPALLLEHSAWKSDPEDLKEFLKVTKASGGQGNEALEIGFWHANKQENLRRVVVIGDAACNTDQEVLDKRGRYGERKYQGTPYEIPTTKAKTLKLLKEKEIVVDTFYMRTGDNQEDFNSMAAYTGGKCQPFSTQRPEGRERLIGHITTSILKYVGGGSGDALVDAYNKKFGKLHS